MGPSGIDFQRPLPAHELTTESIIFEPNATQFANQHYPRWWQNLGIFNANRYALYATPPVYVEREGCASTTCARWFYVHDADVHDPHDHANHEPWCP